MKCILNFGSLQIKLYLCSLLHAALANVLLEHDIARGIEHEFDVLRVRRTRVVPVDCAILVLL